MNQNGSKSVTGFCLARMWSTSASRSAATSSAVASTAARRLVTVESVIPAGSPVSPASFSPVQQCCVHEPRLTSTI